MHTAYVRWNGMDTTHTHTHRKRLRTGTNAYSAVICWPHHHHHFETQETFVTHNIYSLSNYLPFVLLALGTAHQWRMAIKCTSPTSIQVYRPISGRHRFQRNLLVQYRSLWIWITPAEQEEEKKWEKMKIEKTHAVTKFTNCVAFYQLPPSNDTRTKRNFTHFFLRFFFQTKFQQIQHL